MLNKDKIWSCTFLRGNNLCLSTITVTASSLVDAVNKLLESLSEDFVDKYLISVQFIEVVD